MQQDLFSYTTRQFCRTVQEDPGTVRAQYARTGQFRGLTPTKLPNGRLLWPRAETLALAGRVAVGHRVTIDLTTTNPWIESVGLIPSDPGVHAVALALNDPRHDCKDWPHAVRLDEWRALRSWIESATRRLNAARPHLSTEEWTEGKRLRALAVAGVVGDLEHDVVAVAVADVCGGRA
jgi:hypothetical protein